MESKEQRNCGLLHTALERAMHPEQQWNEGRIRIRLLASAIAKADFKASSSNLVVFGPR